MSTLIIHKRCTLPDAFSRPQTSLLKIVVPALFFSLVHRTNIDILVKHGFLMTRANSKTYDAIIFLESNGFKFPQKRGEL